MFLGFGLALVSAENVKSLGACLDEAVENPAKALELAETFSADETEASWLCRASALQALGQFHEAGLVFADLVERTSEPTEIAVLTGQAANAFASGIQNESATKAKQWAEKWRISEPKNIEPVLLQADLASRPPQPELTTALGLALKAQTLAELDQRPRVLAITASIRMKSGDYEAARQDLFSGLGLNENDPTCLFVLGRWLLDRDQVLQAEEIWTRLSKSKDAKWQALAEQELLRFNN